MPSISIIHVFISPGAIRLVSTHSGNVSPLRPASHSSTALSGVSHGAIPPAPSGRSVTTSESSARSVRGISPNRSGRCSACMPRSPMQPYAPLNSAWRFQLIGLFGSRSLECRNALRTSRMRPARPSAIQRATAWPPGKNGISDEQRTTSSGWLATAAMIRLLASRSIPNGFSPSRWRPASRIATYSSACRWCGTAQ